MVMTVVTPMTTPSIVSAERSLLAPRESTAIEIPSPIFRIMGKSFGSQRGDRIEPGGPGGGEHAEGYSCAGSECQRNCNRPERDTRGQGREARDSCGKRPAAEDTLDATQGSQHHRLDEELAPNVCPS